MEIAQVFHIAYITPDDDDILYGSYMPHVPVYKKTIRSRKKMITFFLQTGRSSLVRVFLHAERIY